LKYAEDLIRKATKLLEEAKRESESYSSSPSNVVINCQQCIELSAKAVMKIMDLDFPREHQLLFRVQKGSKKLSEEFKELLKKEMPKHFSYQEELPRLIFLTYFWHEFYTIGKYGIDELDISPDELFKKEDAELAVKHAEFCLRVASDLHIQKKLENNR
jgi:HEPN domain-containing protein